MTMAALIATAALLGGPTHAGGQGLVVQPSLELSCTILTPEMTEADFVERFGAENVSTGSVFGFDDGPQQGTVLYAQRPDARAEIIWWDPKTKRRPALIMVRGPVSRWRPPNGIVLGTNLRALETANGRPFRLAGLQIEGGGGGAVLSWAGGLLEIPVSDQCRNGVHLQPAYDGTEAPNLIRQVASGREYSSGHTAFQALNPRVVHLTLSFTRPRPAG